MLVAIALTEMNYGVDIHAWNLRLETFTMWIKVRLTMLHRCLWLELIPDHQHPPNRVYALHPAHQDRSLASTARNLRYPETELSMVLTHGLDWSQRYIFRDTVLHRGLSMHTTGEDLESDGSGTLYRDSKDVCCDRCDQRMR